MDTDQGDRTRFAHNAQAFHNPRGLRAEMARGGQGFRQHDIAWLGAARFPGRDHPFALLAPIGRDDAPFLINTQDPRRRAASDALESAPFIFARANGLEPREDPFPNGKRRAAFAFRAHIDDGRAAFALPLQRARDRVAIRVCAGHFHRCHIGQAARRDDGAFPGGV